ncbi:PREDICTED: Ig mu heavy chain disease protein-like, partial [Eurypyga helias]|uniref:Ig mu heavy chain disease protein-like n=1 Tax=Eurypyga helias TaxID=54383 RepID=UPI0005289D3B
MTKGVELEVLMDPQHGRWQIQTPPGAHPGGRGGGAEGAFRSYTTDLGIPRKPPPFMGGNACLGREDGVQPEVEVTIVPPSLEDLYLSQNASVTCVATNVKTPEDVKFSWAREKGNSLDVTTGEPESLENGRYRLSSVLKICAEEWNSGEKFTCTVKIPEFDESVTRSIKKDI